MGILKRDKTKDTERRIDTRALFIMIGAAPNTGWLSGHAEVDPRAAVARVKSAWARRSDPGSC